ncbi:MAG: heme exporter protein CcmB [Coriobacteriia bacterium]|nr:heme exporter protein CcmB [Coriobacteriia bacterium]
MSEKRNISSFDQFRAILHKDIVMELRTKEMLTSMGLYALLVLIIYYVALSQAGSAFEVERIAGGLLLLAIVFTSMLGLNRSLVHEKDQGCLEALLLSPVDRPVIFFGKAVGNLIFLILVQILIVPLFYFIFMSGSQVQSGPWWMLALALLVGSIGIAGVGTFLATMSVNTTGTDFILAIMFIPLVFPLLLVVVAALTAVITADAGYTQVYWTMLAAAAGYDVIMIAVAFALYEFIIGA